MKIRALFLVAALAVASTSMAEMITKSLCIKLRNGQTLTLDLSRGEKDGQAVLPLMTFTPTTMKIDLPPRVDPEKPQETIAPASYTFEVEELKSMEPIGTVQEYKSGIRSVAAESSDIALAFTGTDQVTLTGSADKLDASSVELFDMAGRSFPADVTVEAPGRLTLSLAKLEPGVYVIKVQKITLKVTKR